MFIYLFRLRKDATISQIISEIAQRTLKEIRYTKTIAGIAITLPTPAPLEGEAQRLKT